MANNANQPVPRFFLGGSMSSNSDTSASTGSTGSSFDSSVPGDGGQTVPSVQSSLRSMSDNSDDQTSVYPASTESSFDSSVSGDGGQIAPSVQRPPPSSDGGQTAPSAQKLVEVFVGESTAASALDGQTAQSRNTETEKTYHILQAFGVVTSNIQAVMGTASGKNYTDANVVHTEWMRYYRDVGPDACKIVRHYFVDYFGERWNMEGPAGSNARLASVMTLNGNAFKGLAAAMGMYKQRHEMPQSTMPPLPFDYHNIHKYDRFYPDDQLALPLENEPPSPSGSSGRGSNFSMDSDMMFPIDKD